MDFTLQMHNRIGSGPAITVRGDPDYNTCPRFLDGLDRCLQPTPAAVYVDLRRVTFIDSGGLSALVATHKRQAGRCPPRPGTPDPSGVPHHPHRRTRRPLRTRLVGAATCRPTVVTRPVSVAIRGSSHTVTAIRGPSLPSEP
jgi:ABC-type transporter Mla MlaB component